MRESVRVFAEQGYAPTTMADIADRAGVTRAVLYDHFPSKKALFLAVLGEESARFLGHVGAAITMDGDPGRRMRSTVEAVFTFAERQPAAWRLLFTSSRNGDAEVDEAWWEMSRSFAAEVTALLADDLAARGIDADDPRGPLIVDMLIGAVSSAIERGNRHRAASRDVRVDAAMELMWTGLRHRE